MDDEPRRDAVTTDCRVGHRKPTVKINRERKTVAFSRHAVEQLRDRRVGQWDTYQGAGEAFTYLHTWIRFDLNRRCGRDGDEGNLPIDDEGQVEEAVAAFARMQG